MDKDRLEDIKRKKMLIVISAVVVLLTLILCIVLSQMAALEVDTKKGIAKIKELEKADITSIEGAISEIEEKEKKEEEDWKNRPLSEKFANAVIMGDSITTGFLDFGVLDTSTVVAEIGVHLYELEDLITTTVNLNPRVLFLALGLNDVSATGGDTRLFIERYDAVIAELREKLPSTQIYVNLILPVKEKAIERYPDYAKISEYNQALIQYCTEQKIPVIDNSSLVKDEYYEPDGEHLTIDYYPLWAEHMAEEAKI